MKKYKKGDKVTYSNGYTKYINRPESFYKYFDDEFYNYDYDLKIIKIQRYIKILFFYVLITIYRVDRR